MPCRAELVPHLLSLFSREPVPLIGDDDECPAPFEYQAKQTHILLGHAFLRIENRYDHVCFLDRLQRLHDAEFLDRF